VLNGITRNEERLWRKGMQALVKERPNNPVEFLAAYLLKNNPQGPSNQ